MNIIDQWMNLLGLQRQGELARALGKGDEAVSRWKKEGRIPRPAAVTLALLAQSRGVDVPAHLLPPQMRDEQAA